ENDLAPVEAARASADFGAQADGGDVADVNRRAVALGDGDVGDLAGVGQPGGDADDVGIALVLDVFRAGAGVVALQRVGEVVERQAVRGELGRIGRDLVLLEVAALHVDVGDVLHTLDLRADDPVHHRAQVRRAGDVIVQALAFGGDIGAVRLPAGLAIVDLGAFAVG